MEVKETTLNWRPQILHLFRNPFDVQYFGVDESYARFEQLVRSSPEMIHKLKDLESKVLGCW